MLNKPPIIMANRNIHYAWFIFAGCCCLMAGGIACCLSTAGLFYVPVCSELGFSRGELSMYTSFYLVAMVIASPIVGNLLPRVNVRIVMSAACACVVLAEGLMSTYTELWQWYLSGTVFGLCGTFIFLLPIPLMIGNWFKKNTGLVLAIAMSFSGIGAAIWSPLFTFFITEFGWRTAYLCVACVVAILILPWTMFVFRFRPSDMGLLPYGVDEAEARPSEVETKSEVDSATAVSIKAAIFSVPFICIFLLSGVEEFYGGINNNIPAFAISIGSTAAFGATLMSATAVGNVAIKLCVGYLADRVGIIKTTYLQMVVCIVGCALFAFVRDERALVIAAFMMGVQNSVVTISEPMLVRHFFGERVYSQIYSYVRVAAGLLGAIAMPFVGFIYDHAGGYELAFILGIGVAIVNSALIFIASCFKEKLSWKS